MTKRNLSHIASMALNQPLLMEPAYAQVFFSALGKEIGFSQLSIPQAGETLSGEDMDDALASFMDGEARPSRSYRIDSGIAILPVVGTLVHKLGTMRPYSGMTGYDGIIGRLEQAIADPDVKGVMLDIDSPGGQVAGAFDCADVIARMRDKKPVWALSNDMACSAAMLLASACSRRLTTQTGRMGSVGVVMAHASMAGAMEQKGIDVTLIYSGSHKVDGNPYEALPENIREGFQAKIDATRDAFAQKVAGYTGLSVEAVLGTEAAVYEGESAIGAGFADAVVNSVDAVTLMSASIKSNTPEGEMKMSETALQERQRIAGIIGHSAAAGHSELATALAMKTSLSVDEAGELLAAVPVATVPIAPSAEVAASITGSGLAKNHKTLAGLLSKEPGMTLSAAEKYLAAAAADGGDNGFSAFMNKNTPEALGAETGSDVDAGDFLGVIGKLSEGSN